MEMGDRIKFLRRQKGITQEELGQIVGVQKAAVQKWESGMTGSQESRGSNPLVSTKKNLQLQQL